MRRKWTLGSGQRVFDRYVSHILPVVEEVLPEVVQKIYIAPDDSAPLKTISVEFDRIVGVSSIVTTTKKDEIFFAKRKNRKGLSRFVRNRVPVEVNMVTVILKKYRDLPQYVLITAYFGTPTGPEPWDKRATEEDNEFWNNHAFVPELQEIVAGTETEEVPEYFQKMR